MQATSFVIICAIAFVQLPTCFPAGKTFILITLDLFVKIKIILLGMTTKVATIKSNSLATKSANVLKGTMVVANGDKDSLSQSKVQLSNQLTQKLQADTQNTNSKVKVNDVKELSDGTLALDYECEDVADTEAAKKTLNDALKHEDVQKTIGKSSKDDGKSTQKPQQPSTKQSG